MAEVTGNAFAVSARVPEPLSAEVSSTGTEYTIDVELMDALRRSVRSGRLSTERNRLGTSLRPARTDEVTSLNVRDEALVSAGGDAVRSGEVAAVVLAGGMSTRFGEDKVFARLTSTLSLLEWKLSDLHAAGIPAAVVTNALNHERVAAAVGACAPGAVLLQQSSLLRLAPDGSVFLDRSGMPSPYPPGHGELLSILSRPEIRNGWRELGIRHVFVSNVDNPAATLDLALIGLHTRERRAISLELVLRRRGEAGGVAVRHANGQLGIVEHCRLPRGIDSGAFPLLSTNTFFFDLDALEESDAASRLDWFYVEKKVLDSPVVQIEKILSQLTDSLSCTYILVPRSGPDTRFVPVKTPDDLREARRYAARQHSAWLGERARMANK